jgi:hypothetical protein
MRTGLLLCGLVLVSLAGGCVYSTQPLYTPETLRQDLDLAGTWESRGVHEQKFNGEHSATIKKLGGGEFEMRWTEETGYGRTKEQTAVLRTVELNGFTYLDFSGADFPDIRALESEQKPDHDKDYHHILAVRVIGDKLVVAHIDRDKLFKYAARANMNFGGNQWTVILDAPSAELQKFIASNREVFTVGCVWRRVETPPAPN